MDPQLASAPRQARAMRGGEPKNRTRASFCRLFPVLTTKASRSFRAVLLHSQEQRPNGEEKFLRALGILRVYSQERMETLSLLQRHRRDRRKLLEFILSTGLIRTPSGDSLDLSAVDLDAISVDYVLECLESGIYLGYCLVYLSSPPLPVVIIVLECAVVLLQVEFLILRQPPRGTPRRWIIRLW